MNHAKMGFRAFRTELYKGKHRNIWLVTTGFLFILILWAAYTNRNRSAYDLAQGYTNLFFQIPVLNSILMPIMLAVIASRLCDMEIKGDTLKLLYTLEPKSVFYDLKFIHEFLYLLAFSIGEAMMFPVFGTIFHYTETLSIPLLLRHTICLLIAGTFILTLQHILSLYASNQMTGLFVGIAGSFIGLFSAMFPPTVTRFTPWAYFLNFLPYRMDYDNTTRIITYTPVEFPLMTFLLFTLFTVVFYLFCRTLFLNKEENPLLLHGQSHFPSENKED